MKQRITEVQLDEVTEDHLLDILMETLEINPKEDFKEAWGKQVSVLANMMTETIIERCTIGKMIEILSKNYYIGFNSYIQNKFVVKLIKSSFDFEPCFESGFHQEPCDALWEAIKYILTEDK